MKKKGPPETKKELRKKAEAISIPSPETVSTYSPEEINRLLHELDVHKTELEIQNKELREAQDKLTVSRNRYSELYQQAPVGYVTLDPSGMILEANAMAQQMCGHENLRGLPFAELLHSEDADLFRARFPAFFRSSVQKQMEARLEVQGEILHTLITILSNLRDHQDTLLLTLLDVSPRYQAEQRMQAFFEQPAGLHLITKKDGQIEKVNTSWQRSTGYTKAEMEGRFFQEFIHPEDLGPTLKQFEQVRKGERTLQFKNRYRHKNGSWCNLVWWSSQIQDDGRIYAIAHDVTNLNQAQQALTESELRLQQAVSFGNIGFWDWDLETDTVHYSTEWKRQIGYQDDEIGNSFDEWQSRLHPDERDEVVGYIHDQSKKVGTTIEIEFRLRHKAGSWRWIFSQGTVLAGTDGVAQRAVGTHIDITEKKELLLRSEKDRRQLSYLNEILMATREISRILSKQAFNTGLLQAVANILGSQPEVYSAWIALVNSESETITDAFVSESTPAADKVANRLISSGLPSCARACLSSETNIVTWEPANECPDCPMGDLRYEGHTGVAQRMECDGQIYGVISLAIPNSIAKEIDHHKVIVDLAKDLAFVIANAEYRKQRDLNIAALESTTDSVFWIAPGGSFVYANQAATNKLGYSLEELQAMSVVDIDPDLSEDGFEQLWNSVKKTGSTKLISHHKTKEGVVFPVEVFSTFIKREQEEYVFTFVHDISNRIRKENELKAANERLISANLHLERAKQASMNIMEDAMLAKQQAESSQARYQRLAEKNPAVVFQFHMGPEGHCSFSYITESVETTLGPSREEVEQDPNMLINLIVPEQREVFFSAVQKSAEELSEFSMEIQMQTTQGLKWIQALSKPERQSDGEIIWDGFFNDITHRKTIEMKLVNAEKRNRALLDYSPLCHKIVDLDGNLQYINQNGLRMFQLDNAEDLYGRPYPFEFFPEDFKQEMTAMMTWVCKTREVLKAEGRSVDSQGNEIWLDSYLIPVPDDQGELDYITIVTMNVTEQRDLQHQLLQSRKLESIGQLAGGVAHDFNNQLMAIINYADFIREELEEDHPALSHLKEIDTAAMRSADLTRQLLAFARKQKIMPKVIDLDNNVAGMLKMLRRLIGEHIDLAYEPGSDIWPIKVDPSQIDQILANLCVNARDAIEGSGKVTIGIHNKTLDKSMYTHFEELAPGDYVEITVEDTGKGMDENVMNRIFEPFFTTKEVGKGTGLGLATVHGIIKQNNGHIRVESSPGQGTKFVSYLPRYHGPTTEQPDETQPDEKVGGSETILVVEDEKMIRAPIVMQLEQLGYTVLSAEDGLDAYRKVDEHEGKIDLILTDVVMPNESGYDMARKMKNRYPQIKCIFMSGYTADILQNHGEAGEEVDLLFKPFNIKQLSKKVREVLEKEIVK